MTLKKRKECNSFIKKETNETKTKTNIILSYAIKMFFKFAQRGYKFALTKTRRFFKGIGFGRGFANEIRNFNEHNL